METGHCCRAAATSPRSTITRESSPSSLAGQGLPHYLNELIKEMAKVNKKKEAVRERFAREEYHERVYDGEFSSWSRRGFAAGSWLTLGGYFCGCLAYAGAVMAVVFVASVVGA